MAVISIRRFGGGIDASAPAHELADDRFVELANLMPRGEWLEPRPTTEVYLTGLSAPVLGLAEFSWGPGATTGMQTAGPLYPRVVSVDNSIGTAAWANDQAAKNSDDLWAKAQPDALDSQWKTTYRLVLKDFGFVIPSNAQILGVRVDIERHYRTQRSSLGGGGSPLGSPKDYEVRLTTGAALSGNRARPDDAWSRSQDRWDAYGHETDLWGLALTPAAVNSADFGVVFSAQVTGYRNEWDTDYGTRVDEDWQIAYIDAVRVTVYYRILEGGLFGKEIVAKAGPKVYTDRSGSWQQVNTGTGQDLDAGARMRAAAWLGALYIQDGMTGPWKYVGLSGTFGPWGQGSANPPPVAKYILLDRERLYLGHTSGGPSTIRASTVSDPDDWPLVASPGSDKGMQIHVGKDDGDFITGLVRFGSVKVVLKRRSIWALYGDDADSWQLRRLFGIGCEEDYAWADMGWAAVWTDGARVYLWDGNQVTPDFGLPVEKYVQNGPGPRMLAYWDGRLLLWYSPSDLVVWDSRYKSWFGPWEGVHALSFLVRRDDGVLMLGDSVGFVKTLTGSDAVPWRIHTKHYDWGQPLWEHYVRRWWIQGSELGRMVVRVVDGSRTVDEEEATIGAPRSTVSRVVGRRAERAGLQIVGTSARGSAAVHEISLEAELLRRLVRR